MLRRLRRRLNANHALLPAVIGSLLCVVAFCAVQHANCLLPAPESFFVPPISNAEYSRLLALLRDFQTLMRRHNASFMTGGGTLIGSFRHHGIVPWDDDVDVFAFDEQRERVRAALTDLPAEMSYYTLQEGEATAPAWKFFDRRSPHTYYQHSFRWPFVDIFFLRRLNKTHVFHEEFGPTPRRLDQLLPLTLRPFADLMLPSPCNVSYVLDFLDVRECQNRAFSHLVGFSMPLWMQYRLPCRRLWPTFPFVKRRVSALPNGGRRSTEALMVGKTVIHELTLRLPKCEVTKR